MTIKALGDDNLRKLEELADTECNGVVKAVSKPGDWFYAPQKLTRMNIVAHPIQESEADLSVIVAGTE